jgi:hypothetical protein
MTRRRSSQSASRQPTRLQRINIPSSVADSLVPTEIHSWVTDARTRIEAFQDRWDRRPIEQFVAADYELVYQSLRWTLETQTLIGNRFLEWGSGFATMTALASTLGLDAIGIESEPTLFAQGQKTLVDWNVQAELVRGNFLPRAAEQLADDPTLPSLGHELHDAYASLGLDVDDFAMIYAYPWPGEDDFLEAVFAEYAAPGAYLLLFCGPNDVRLIKKAA